MRQAHKTLLLITAFSFAGVGSTSTAGYPAQSIQLLDLRRREQKLHLYGSRSGDPVIVSSGDGGWLHLAPAVAQLLAAHGFFVVGFDVRAYLSGFTTAGETMRTQDVPGDFRALVQFATKGAVKKPILIGVSEGAGLSVLAATDPGTKAVIAGVIGLGLPDRNELGWRWKDAIIYLSHSVPNEPTFSVRAIVAKVSPVPLAAIHSTHDEFVPVADVQKIMDAAGEPKKLWIINAADHRFSGNLPEFDQRMLEAIAWVRERTPH
jgi:alpha-beta hydrolase superfamily lysophospholipase